MVAIEEDQPHHPTTPRMTRSNEDEERRRCYSVKICIDKSPRGLPSKGTRNVPQQKEDSPCLPPLPPPILDDIPECVSWDPPLEAQNLVNDGCGKRFPKLKAGGRRMRNTRENYCQTESCRQQHRACDPIWEVPVKPTSTYSEAGTQSCAILPVTSESHAQTINKEVKHCGLQTSICERSTTACQTDLERHCAAVGISHDRKSCTKPCCIKEKVQKRDISQNHWAPSPNCKLSPDYGNKNVWASNCACRTRASCERKHPTTFPFIGRTPSGNFKVAPSMVSYENNEFGILVANPQSVRTTVRKLRSCQSASLPIRGLEGCPQCCCCEKACCIRQSQQNQYTSQFAPLRRTTSDEGYKTPRGVSPPPPLPPPQQDPRQIPAASTERNDHDRWAHDYHHHQHHPHHDYNQNYNNYPGPPEVPTKVNEPVYEPPQQRHPHHHLMESNTYPPPPEKVSPPHNNDIGHVDRWNYVNPKYNNDHYSPMEGDNKLASPGGRQGEQRYSDQQHGRRTSLEEEPPRNTPNTGYQLQAGLEKLQQLNEMKNTFDTYQQHYQQGNLTASQLPKHLEDIGQKNPFLKEHIDNGLQKWKQVNDMKDTYGKYYQNIQDVTAGFRPDAQQEPPKVVVTDHHHGEQLPPNKTPAVKHHRLDPEEDLYRHEEGHTHRHSIEHPHQNQYQHEQNRHVPENDHQHHHDHHQHLTHDDKEYGQHHHHHQHEHENPDKRNQPENRQMPRTGNTAKGQNGEGWLSLEMENKPDSPEQISVKAQETLFQIVVPDSDYQLTETSESDPSGMEEPPPTSPTEIMSKDEFQNNPGSKRKHSSGVLVTEDEPLVGVLPNLDTQKGRVLLFGGINPKLPYGPGNSGRSVHMYTRETNKWTRVGLLPSPRAHFGLARVGHHVYLIGGTDPQQKDENGKNIAVSTVYRLDLRTGEWDTVAELFKARSHFGCVAVGHHIYIVGGNIDSRATKSCIVYHTVTHKEDPIAPLGITRSNMGITPYGAGVMIAGGTTKDPQRPVLETVTCYDPSKNRWTPWTNLPAPRAFCSLVVAKKQIYLVAGAGMRNYKKRGNSSLPDVLQYNEGADEWQDVGMLSTPRHGHTAVALVDDIIVIGGVSSHTMGALDSVEIFSPANGMTSIKKSLSQNKSGMSALAL